MPKPEAEFDLNCDLGEGEPPDRTLALLDLVDSANLATGGHAGDERSLRFGLAQARLRNVHAGAHPGLPGGGDFGRTARHPVSPDDLRTLLADQLDRFAAVASELGVPWHHVKLHGALYHAVEADPDLARVYLEGVVRHGPGRAVYARCGGEVQAAASRVPGVDVWAEAFLDRAYADDGTLVPRGTPGALVTEPAEVRRRLVDLRTRAGLPTAGGGWVSLQPRTLCLHGDSPRAVECLREIRREMPRPPGRTSDPHRVNPAAHRK